MRYQVFTNFDEMSSPDVPTLAIADFTLMMCLSRLTYDAARSDVYDYTCVSHDMNGKPCLPHKLQPAFSLDPADFPIVKQAAIDFRSGHCNMYEQLACTLLIAMIDDAASFNRKLHFRRHR